MSGHITANATWAGPMTVGADVTVDPGVTLTVMPSATITMAGGAGIVVDGIVDVQGAKGSLASFLPTDPAGHHSGFRVDAGGTLKMAYGVIDGGGVETLAPNAKVIMTDSAMSRAAGDFLVMNGGDVNITYSRIGLEPGKIDTTHCDMHFGGTANTVVFMHNDVSTSSYGVMFYGGNNVNFTYNNWFSNQIDIDFQPGVSGDVSYSWFEKGAPVAPGGVTLTKTNLAAARLIDAGPRL